MNGDDFEILEYWVVHPFCEKRLLSMPCNKWSWSPLKNDFKSIPNNFLYAVIQLWYNEDDTKVAIYVIVLHIPGTLISA